MVWLETLPHDWWNKYQSIISLSSHCIQELDIELLFIVRSLLLETRAYARVCKRMHLRVIDFQAALQGRNIHQNKNLCNRIKRENTTTVSILSLIDQSNQLSSKIDGLELTMHWLAIDGEQPVIPENPLQNFFDEYSVEKIPTKIINRNVLSTEILHKSPLLESLFEIASSTEQKNYEYQKYVHPLTKNNLIMKPIHSQHISARRLHNNNNNNNNCSSSIKSPLESCQPCLSHELSIEQQLYFKILTESCFNETDKKYSDALQRLSSDAALQPLLPRLLLFIARGIQTNIHLHDLSFTIQFLSILKMLTLNKFLSFHKYLHSIIPILLTCHVCFFDMLKNDHDLTKIDYRNSDNYSTIWILREQASDLVSYFTTTYSNISYLTERITSIIKSNLTIKNKTTTFSIIYACIRTLLMINVQILVHLQKIFYNIMKRQL